METKIENLNLTQDPSPAGGSFPVGSEATYNGSWYEAHATDNDGAEYIVRWTSVDWDAEDASDACDWDAPDYIQKL
jgi:hypothetical protein